jgi:16S rRNA (adenine1518-N6/adenine1519-N6)-dimethyltransferase
MPVRKRFGQNFLRDRNTIDRIIAAIDPAPGDHIVEIGPGHGALTDRLIESGCQLDVIEIDFDLTRELDARYGDRARIIEADVLRFDLTAITNPKPIRVVGNLPYNISTPLLFKLFQHLNDIRDMHFMLQLEVVDRMIAQPSTGTYGRLSIMCQYYCKPTRLFSVPAAAFHPRPRVMSSVIRLEPRTDDERKARDVAVLENLLTRSFSQRRKTIRNAMKPFLSMADFEALELDPGLRPENLTLDQFVDCANRIATKVPG